MIVLALLGLIALGVLPVRTYVEQKNELTAKQARKAMLDERNLTLSKRVAALQTDDEVIKLARLHYGLVPKGDTLTVIPGLRDESATLDAGDGEAVGPVPAAVDSEPSSFVETIQRLLVFWR